MFLVPIYRNRIANAFSMHWEERQNLIGLMAKVSLLIVLLVLFWPICLAIVWKSTSRDRKNSDQLVSSWGETEVSRFVAKFEQDYPTGLELGDELFLWKPVEQVFDEVPYTSREEIFRLLSNKGLGLSGAA